MKKRKTNFLKYAASWLLVLCMLASLTATVAAQAPLTGSGALASDIQPDEKTADMPDAPADPDLVDSFFELYNDAPDHYALTEDFSGVQGPYWYYKILNSETGQLEEMTYDSPNTRWISNIHGNHWMRIFPDGMMPTNTGNIACDCEPVLEWVAPKAGVVAISAEEALRMEEIKDNRDGVTVSLWHNGAQVWPSQGGVAVDPHLDNSTDFDTLRLVVAQGDTLHFRTNKRAVPNNDRVFWKPVIDYVAADAAVMANAAVPQNGTFTFVISNYAGAPAPADVSLFARVNDGLRQAVPVTGVALQDGVVTVGYAAILPPDGQETATVQLSCLFAGDSRTVAFTASANEEETEQHTITATAHENGSISPDGEVAVAEGEDQTFTISPANGYEIERVEVDGSVLAATAYAGSAYTFANVQEPHTIEVWFAARQVESGVTYYISPTGSDDADGKTEATAWQTLDKVNNTTFQPGDKILFQSGGIWNGWLWPKGSGAPGNPITLGKYGGDAYPVFNSTGDSPLQGTTTNPTAENRFNPTVFLCDQSYWVIENLEVTNNARNDRNNQGILIYTTGTVDSGLDDWRVYDVTVRGCYVHDVTSTTASAKLSGGILGLGSVYHIDGSTVFPAAQNTARRDLVGFDGLVFENNHVKNVAKEGVRTSGTGDGSPFRNRKTHRNVTIRGNYIEEVFGDGIVLAEVGSGGLVEHNVVKNHCNYNTVNYAGLWDWYCNDSVVRYNEVFGGEYGYNDGEAFDFDNGSTNFTYEYNFSHHNKGGLLLTMSGAGQTTNNFRYNVSVNDGKAAQALFHIPTQNAKVYNNTMYIGKGYNTSVYDGSGSTLNFFKNNILLVHGEMPSFSRVSLTLNSKADICNNIFYPANIMENGGLPEDVLANNILLNPGLSSPQLFEEQYQNSYDGLTYESMGSGEAFVSGMRLRAQNFKLAADSIAIDAGAVIPGAPAQDFFGNAVSDGKPDIGAHEFSGDPGPSDPSGENTATDLQLDKAALYLLVGNSDTLTATVLPSIILDRGVTWTSSDESVATVSAAGKITAIAPGETTVTARSNATPSVFETCRVVVGEPDSNSFVAVKDTHIRDNNADIGGGNEALEVKNDAVNYNRHTLLGFSLDGAPQSYSKALLRIYGKAIDNANTLNFHETGFDWAESVRWNDAPAAGSLAFSVAVTSTDSNGWLEIDITDYIRGLDLVQQPNLAFRVSAATLMQNQPAFEFYSRESGYKPQIVFVSDGVTVTDIESPTVRTVAGVAPVLPATVTVTYSDSGTEDKAVQWETIDPNAYAAEGSFVVLGAINGISRPVMATVRVLQDYPVAIQPVNVSTPAGMAPVLPAEVTAEMAAGGTTVLPVVWAAFDAGKYAEEGSFTVAGTIDNFAGEFFATVVVGPAEVSSVLPVAVTGLAGYAPVLPAQVDCLYTDGSAEAGAVVWETMDPADYQNAGSFTVKGAVGALEATANVTVYAVESTETVIVANPQGKYPALPGTVELTVSGQAAPLSWPVAWQPVAKADYDGDADFTVTGLLAGTLAEVTAQVHQLAPIEENDGSLKTVGDTFIRMGTSGQTNGSDARVLPKGYTGNYKRDGLFQFDLSGVENAEQITTLTLRLAVESLDKLGGGYIDEFWFSVYANGSSWNEATASWDNITQNGAEYKQKLLQGRVVITSDAIGKYVEIDVSEALPYMDDSGKLSFLVAIDENPADSNDGQNGGINFYAKEHSDNMPAMLDYSTRYVTGVEEVKRVVAPGEMPQLPETVEVTYSNGDTAPKAVVWDGISPDQVAAEGTFYVRGYVQGLYMDLSATIVVQNTTAALEKLVADIEVLNPNEAFYTSESWARFAAAMAAAKGVLAQPSPAAEEVSAAYNELLAAYQDLTLIASNMMELLTTFVTALDKLEESSFTPESWPPFKAALAEAHRLMEEGDAEDTEILEVLDNLLTAQKKLVRDKAQALRLMIAEAEALLQNADNYYSGSVNKLRAELDAAKELLKTPMEELEQKDIDDASMALFEAISTLFEKGDITALQILVRYAKELRGDMYTTASWQVFAAALKTADEKAAANDMLPEEVDEVYNALYRAIEGLVPAANKSALASVIAVAQSIVDNKDKYIPATLAGLEDALTAAKALYAKDDATQTEVDKTASDLLALAMKARKPANKEALKQALGYSGRVTGTMTQAGLEELTSIVAQAKQVLANPQATQEDVDTVKAAVDTVVWAADEVVNTAPASNAAKAPAVDTAPAGNEKSAQAPAGENTAETALPEQTLVPGTQPETTASAGSAANPLWIVLLVAALAAGLVVYRKRQASK